MWLFIYKAPFLSYFTVRLSANKKTKKKTILRCTAGVMVAMHLDLLFILAHFIM